MWQRKIPLRQNIDDINVTLEDRGRARVFAITSRTHSFSSKASDKSQSGQIRTAGDWRLSRVQSCLFPWAQVSGRRNIVVLGTIPAVCSPHRKRFCDVYQLLTIKRGSSTQQTLNDDKHSGESLTHTRRCCFDLKSFPQIDFPWRKQVRINNPVVTVYTVGHSEAWGPSAQRGIFLSGRRRSSQGGFVINIPFKTSVEQLLGALLLSSLARQRSKPTCRNRGVYQYYKHAKWLARLRETCHHLGIKCWCLMSSQQHFAALKFHLITSHISEVCEGDPLQFLDGYIKTDKTVLVFFV